MKLLCLVVLIVLIAAGPAYSDAPSSPVGKDVSSVSGATISGQLMIGKKPMINGFVFLYDKALGPPPSFYKYWRIPDQTHPADKDGRFLISVPEGTYYLQATQKDPDTDVGPAKVDEYNYLYGDADWNPLPLSIKSGEKVNLGVMDTFPVPVKWQQFDTGITAIEGAVSDMEGKPVVGAMVFAYLSKNTTGRPVFVSTSTDINGKYQLRVHDGGTFYLKIRGVFGGGAPVTGEYVSTEESVAAILKKGQKLTGVALKAKKFSRINKVKKQ